MKEKTLQPPRAVKEEERRCCGRWSRGSPQPLGQPLVRQLCPAPREDPTLKQVDVPEGGCDPVRSPCWSRLLAGVVAPWSRFAGRTCDPVGDPCWSSLFLKDCTQWEGPVLEQFMKNCSPWEGLMSEKVTEGCLP